jgi:putative transposase
VSRQCELLGLSRSSFYYQPRGESAYNLELMRRIDQEYTAHPFYGSRKIVHVLRGEGHAVNKKRVARLMGVMGLQAMTPGPHTSRPSPEHTIYPYRLRGLKIERADQVWSCDITYLPLPQGFLYLFAVIDWHSRFVLSWTLSNTLEVAFWTGWRRR